MNPLIGRSWWLATAIVFVVALLALVPTTADFGLTWDEPAYRYSQELSAQWWERLAMVRNQGDLAPLLDPEALLYYWHYGRHGINFHPPLAGQLNLLTYQLFGRWLADYPARRLASVLEFAATVTFLFGFLSRRYGPWVGGIAAGSLLFMPRLHGQAHLVDTDTPGLLLWAGAAVAFWKGLQDPGARRWRVALGVLVGLAFVEKMGTVLVVLPILAWLVVFRLPRANQRDWVDGLATSAAMLLPLAVAFFEIRRLAVALPQPKYTDLFIHRRPSLIPGVILLLPMFVWLVRRSIGRFLRSHPTWSGERPALELWTSLLAFAPAVAWLGNPAWWREALPRLAHYYRLNTDRRGSLPDIQILYFGQTYEYSLPWHNGFVLMAITVPAAILLAAAIGLIFGLKSGRRDRLPLYFLLNLLTMPVLRMFPTPAHDGVRLFLPTFFFLSAFAGWGAVWLAEALADRLKVRASWTKAAIALAVLVPSARQLIAIHPYELSYYNELIGGPAGAWRSGFELTYWFDAMDGPVLDDLNRLLPPGAAVQFANKMSNPVMVPLDLQSLGHLRGDLKPGDWPTGGGFPYIWYVTQDSKADGFSRLLFGLKPWYDRRPRQLGGVRVFTVDDPSCVSRAWALQILADAPDLLPADPPASPRWVRSNLPFLGRFWGDGITRVHRLTLNEPLFDWARRDPSGFLEGARALARLRPSEDETLQANRIIALPESGRQLLSLIVTKGQSDAGTLQLPTGLSLLLRFRPSALVEASTILTRRPDAVRAVLTRYSYTDPDTIGGYLDRDIP